MNQPMLLEQIEAFDIDGGNVVFTFSQRLARENGWSPSYSQRVVREYKRFAYLCMVDGPCTPSEEVDQAWHLHMLYTESYWDRFCGQVLPKPLKHGPTTGGHAEAAKFADWYAHTLDAYRREFGEEPPTDIWPAPENRFQGRFTRVNLDQNWVIPKAPIQRWAMGSFLAFTAVGATGCAVAHANVTENRLSIIFVAILVVAFIGILAWAASHSQGNGRRQHGSSGCGGASGCGSGHHGDGGDSSGCGSSGCGSGCGGGGCGGGGCGGG